MTDLQKILAQDPFAPSLNQESPFLSFDKLAEKVKNFFNEWIEWIEFIFSAEKTNSSSSPTQIISNTPPAPENANQEISPIQTLAGWTMAQPTRVARQTLIGTKEIKESFNNAMEIPVSEEGKKEAVATPLENAGHSDTSAPTDIVPALDRVTDELSIVVADTINSVTQNLAPAQEAPFNLEDKVNEEFAKHLANFPDTQKWLFESIKNRLREEIKNEMSPPSKKLAPQNSVSSKKTTVKSLPAATSQTTYRGKSYANKKGGSSGSFQNTKITGEEAIAHQNGLYSIVPGEPKQSHEEKSQ